MSVYFVTTDQRVLSYSPPWNKTIWLRDGGNYYHIYWKDCTCVNCVSDAHRNLIAYVQKAEIVSIGFERPVCVEGRLLTEQEKRKLTNLKDWLERKKLPRKLDIAPLKLIAK